MNQDLANRGLPVLEEAEPADESSPDADCRNCARCRSDQMRDPARHRRHAARSGADAARGVGAAGPRQTRSTSLLTRTTGALALVSGRSLNDIDLIFAPEQFPAVGGHGAEMRLSTDSEAVATHAPPMDKELKRRLAAIAKLSPGILLEDKGYSLALHYRLAPHAEKAIYEAVSLIRADLPNAPIEVLPGKCVCEIKHSGFNKATRRASN